MSLTKDHITNSIQYHLNLPKTRSSQLAESLLELIKVTLESGEDVLISGFGKFSVKQKHARRGRNPANGKNLTLVFIIISLSLFCPLLT